MYELVVRVTDASLDDLVASMHVREARRFGDGKYRYDAEITVDRGSAIGVYRIHAYTDDALPANPLGVLRAVLNSLEPHQLTLEGDVVDSSNDPDPGPPALEWRQH